MAAPFGRWTADDLDLLADEAERSGRGELRLTPWRALLLPGIGAARAARLAADWADRFVVDPSDPRLAVAACPGAPACGNATTFTHRDALALADAARGLAREGVAVHVSGCAKGCARQAASPVTLVGRDGAYDVVYAGTARDEPARRGVAPERLAETIREAAEAARTTV
ncbi:hypothetical protein NK718_14935 [Alsobacter sp. SYSU M60028]|uniref:Nitrite/Sulfite reductase ferredoxin-like domain-containing protein n=1 Tax=Alsobacter ponti TaxID=2962936 RepID=A0ABT1LE88_9HYPH|nr:hypothetical protein [Alsobacter ponti]